MIKQVMIDNHYGESITIKLADPENYAGQSDETGIFISEIEGLGPAKADINMGEVATQHGARFISSRAKTRDFIFHFLFFDVNGVTAEECRLKIYKYFPLGEKITLQFKTGKRTAWTTGYVESIEPDIFSEQVGATVTVTSPSSWLNLTYPSIGLDYTFSNLDSLFEFEFEDPVSALPTGSINFGNIESRGRHPITYQGEAETGMKIRIIAKEGRYFVNPTIYNLETNEYIQIETDIVNEAYDPNWSPYDGHYVACIDGSAIEISTVSNNKYVRYYPDINDTTSYINVLSAFTMDSTWLTIHPGVNYFGYECEEGEFDVDIQITASILVGGV